MANRSRTLAFRAAGRLLCSRARVPALAAALFVCAQGAARADATPADAPRAQAFRDAIAADVHAGALRGLASAREHANRTLRGLPTGHSWQAWLESDSLALCGAADLDLHAVSAMPAQADEVRVARDLGGS